MINWPSNLPSCFVSEDFQEQGADNILASENDVGPAKLRRRSTSTPYEMVGSMILTRNQKAEFKSFAATTISGCVKAFYFPDPDGGDDLLVRLKPDFSFIAYGRYWKVALELEVLP